MFRAGVAAYKESREFMQMGSINLGLKFLEQMEKAEKWVWRRQGNVKILEE